MRKKWVVVSEYPYEGLGEPDAIFDSEGVADAFASFLNKKFSTSYIVVEVNEYDEYNEAVDEYKKVWGIK